MKYVKAPGAYILTHKPTGLFYIGSSNNLHARLGKHRNVLDRKEHYIHRLQEVYTTWGDMGVSIWQTLSIEEARDTEQTLLNEHYGTERCTNRGTGARSSWLKGTVPDHVKEAVRSANTGRLRSPDTIARLKAFHQQEEQLQRRRLAASKRASINGKVYESATEACAGEGCVYETLRNRIASDNPKFKDWMWL